MSKPLLVILVPGAKYVRSPIKPVQRLIAWVYDYTKTTHPIYQNYIKHWQAKLEPEFSTITLDWNRGISPQAIAQGAESLRSLIAQYNNHDIRLVGISMGGRLILEMLRTIDIPLVSQIILVCSAHSHNHEVNPAHRIINIYSEEDELARLAIKTLSPLNGGQPLCGDNVTNVILPDMSHSEFCSDAKIKEGVHQGKHLTDLVAEFLRT